MNALANAYGPMAVQRVLVADTAAGIDMSRVDRVLRALENQHREIRLESYAIAHNGAYRQALFAVVQPNDEIISRPLVIEFAPADGAEPRTFGAEAWPGLWLVVRQPEINPNAESPRQKVRGFAGTGSVDSAAAHLVRLARLIQESFPATQRVGLPPLDQGFGMRPEGLE